MKKDLLFIILYITLSGCNVWNNQNKSSENDSKNENIIRDSLIDEKAIQSYDYNLKKKFSEFINTISSYKTIEIDSIINISPYSNTPYDSLTSKLEKLEDSLLRRIFTKEYQSFFIDESLYDESYLYSIKKIQDNSYLIFVLTVNNITYAYLDCFKIDSTFESEYYFSPSFRDYQPNYRTYQYGYLKNDTSYRMIRIMEDRETLEESTIIYYDSSVFDLFMHRHEIIDSIKISEFKDTIEYID